MVVPAAGARISQADIDKLEKESDKLADEKADLERQLSQLAKDKSKALERKRLLDQRIGVVVNEIANTEELIANYEQLIAQRQEELSEAQGLEAEQYALFCRRVRNMEERGTISYWSVLFDSSSFSAMLSALDSIYEIMSSDQKVIDNLKATQADISQRKAELETNKAGAEQARKDLVSKKADLTNQYAEAEALVYEIQNNQAEYKEVLAELDAEEERIRKEIVEMSKKLAEQQAADAAKAGGYIWPTDSRYITSTIGGRESPGGIGSTNHKGTDIGRVGYTSPIYASKAGTVIVSQYSSSYGHYVVIAHGSGNTTLYAHMSSRKVKVGDVVKQGQTIGISGSTGNSTGPHLHFEIMENGVIINPLDKNGAHPRKGYLTGYTLSSSA
ncbi:MAG: peptidase M23 [Ruminococcaceae bacterium]|nr:peptidase M23 [Oscillospiraceae bacterium]